MSRVGFVASSGGGVFSSAIRIRAMAGIHDDVAIVTDRLCGAEHVAAELGLHHTRVAIPDAHKFSRVACEWLARTNGSEWVALFFTRLVTEELFGRIPCVNFHPSALPEYQGLHALQRAWQDRAPVAGATAHWVEDSVDGGKQLLQVQSDVNPEWDFATLQRVSYVHKLHLLLSVWEAADRGVLLGEGHNDGPPHYPIVGSLNCTAVKAAFTAHLADEGLSWVTFR